MKTKLNKFNLSHEHKTSMDMGYLVPVGTVETLPGDWFRFGTEFLTRFMPTLSPVMQIFKGTLRAYYVPYRLLMEQGKWYKFLTGGEKTGLDSVTLPTISSGDNGFAVGSLADHLGFPVNVGHLSVSAFPFRAYALIYNEWYKNQAIQDDVAVSLAEGPDVTTNTTLLKKNWQRDYFTDGLPSVQKGNPAVIGVSSASAPVSIFGTGKTLGFIDGDSNKVGLYTAGVDLRAGTNQYDKDITSALGSVDSGSATKLLGVTTDGTKSGLQGLADLTNVAVTTINQLRLAGSIQKFQEANMRGGSRPVEFIYNHYGVVVPDATIQRPILIGGFSSDIMISEVLQTSASTEDSAQGSMAGHGIGAGVSPVFNFHCTEHGLIIFLFSVMPKTAYFQGLPKKFNKTNRYQFGFPILNHVGEQGVKNSEIFAQGSNVVDSGGNIIDDKPFAYLPNYQEYRSCPSEVTGEFRTSLDFWHDARKFASLPALNEDFITCTPDTRIWAVESGDSTDHLLVQMVHHIKALRHLSKYGEPGIHIV